MMKPVQCCFFWISPVLRFPVLLVSLVFSFICYLIYCFKDFVCNLRDNGISEGFKSVHPLGYPMSHSTHIGFRLPDSFEGLITLPSNPLSGTFFKSPVSL